jgi:hypothetical protein
VHSPGFTCGSLGYWENQPAVGLPPVRGFPTLCVRRPHRHSLGPRRCTPRLHSATFRSPSHPVGSFPCSRSWTPATSRRWRFPDRPSALCGSPTRSRRGRLSGSGLFPLTGAEGVRLLLRLLGDSMRWLSSSAREDRGPLPRRITPASGGCTLGRLRQAPPLAGLLPAHGTLQGHAAHLVERSTTLSPNDSWGACPPTWDYRVASFVHSKIALHGALHCVVRWFHSF